ncbi:MAG TPA: MFS transporter [Stellaceae bacterium]|nr:MFS transporter [Stellaceae bacterium]
MAQTIDVNEAIERVGIGRLAIIAMALCFCMMLADGYDFASLAVATPAILREWHLQPKDMGLVFSVTFFGLLVGSLFYGWLGDRFGRKFTIVFGTFNFGLPVLGILWASNTYELMVLRFLGGIGMGGIVPIAYTLVSEYAPRRLRSSVVVITQVGYTLGAALTGLVAAPAIPVYGWQFLFALGAGASLVMGFLLMIALPESPLFLALRRPSSPKLLGLVRRLLPGERIEPDARFIATDPQDRQSQPGKETVKALFHGPRAAATSLIWVLFICDSLGFFFLASWLPVVMEDVGVSHSTASLAQSLFGFAGMIGGFGIMRFLDKIGPVSVVVLPVLGAPFELLMGAPGLPIPAVMAAVAGAGICLSGIHYAVYGIVVRFYPPSIRGRGVSAATVWGRAGGIIAPYVGGYFLSAHMPLEHLMMVAASPCIATAVVGIALGFLYRRHFDLPVAAAA